VHTILRPFISEIKEEFYNSFFTPCIVDVHPYKNILLTRYKMAQKTVKFVEVVPKTVGSATFCDHRNAIMSYNLKKYFPNIL